MRSPLQLVFALLIVTPHPAGAALDCSVVFSLSDDVTLGSFQFESDYSAAPGYFVGEDGSVHCSKLVAGALSASNDDDENFLLDLGLTSIDGFDGPLDLFQCQFRASQEPDPEDFEIVVSEASDPDLVPVAPLPDAAASVVECVDGGIECGDKIVEEGEECDDGNDYDKDSCPSTCQTAICGDGFVRDDSEHCDDGNTQEGDGCSMHCNLEPICGDATGDRIILASDAFRALQAAVGINVECPAFLCDVDGVNGVGTGDALRILRRSVDLPVVMDCGSPSAILIRLVSPTTLGALQLNIGYERVLGELDGEGEDVACSTKQSGIESAFNDKPERMLSASFLSLSGIRGPSVIARCGFTPASSVFPEDFNVVVLDARDRNGNMVTKPVVRVAPD